METLSPTCLPDDVEALKAMVVENARSLRRRDAELQALNLLVEKLKHQLAVLRRGRFGASSESLGERPVEAPCR